MAYGELAYLSAETAYADELQPGTVLFHGQYTITRFISSGGFGITYLAKDSLDRDVVIKECFASGFCHRSRTRVRPSSQGKKSDLDKIVRKFATEALRLAKLKHPNVVGVHQVFEDNDTAYMALDYIRGKDLFDLVDDQNGGLTPDRVVEITGKLVSTLAYVHDNGILHCDISPDNIFINDKGEPILIDFGAARAVSAGTTQKTTGPVVVKDGYSPHELYLTGGNSGPWTDIYSLAASLYLVVAGEMPISSQSRLSARAEGQPDPLEPLAGRFPGYPKGFLESIDKAMAVLSTARFQSVGEWLAAMKLPDAVEATNVRPFRLLRRVPEPTPPPARRSVRTMDSFDKLRTLVLSPTGQSGIDISGLSQISGFIGACLIDSQSGEMLAAEGGKGINLQAVGAANAEIIRAKQKAVQLMGVEDHIDDVLVSMGSQLHMIRPLATNSEAFLFVALDRNTANLGMARVQVRQVEQSIALRQT
jgi:serine/threonine protein kinase